MKIVTLHFEDAQHKKLKDKKKEMRARNWEKFILELAGVE